MDLSFLDWISLIANIVTILGISGFLNDYLNKRKDEKKNKYFQFKNYQIDFNKKGRIIYILLHTTKKD